MPGRIWSRGYCRGVAGLGGAGVWPLAGLMLSSAVLGLAAGVSWPWGCYRGWLWDILCVSGVRVVGVDQAIKGH